MVAPQDVEAEKLIRQTAERLKELGIVKPGWIGYVKSGSHVERAPEDKDFWYVRCASLLRKLYVSGAVGVSRLRVAYGGRKGGGVGREHFRRAGGSILRHALQSLEKAGLITKGTKGRTISAKGTALLSAAAKAVK